ncbi:MAG: hypothetical protein MJ236_02445 [Clostridia bacterium]|nr:hypothetical protein [Clostridia bacterium]
MRLVYYLLIFMVLFVGLFMLICGIFNVSSNDLEKKLKKRSSAKKKSNLDLKLNDLSEYISTKLKLNENKRAKLVSDLIAAGIDISPERYTSDAIVSAFLVLPLSIPCAFVSPMLAI